MRICLSLVLLSLAGCGGGGDGDSGAKAFDYTPVTAAQLSDIQSLWASRDLSPRDVQVVHQVDSNAAYQLRLYQHTVEGRVHYGAVTIPKGTATSYPVVVFLDGLDQSNPTMDVARWEQNAQARLGQAVFIVPVFRGRTLIYNGISLTAAGDFCDAYDGAADDAIALMNVVAAEIPQADFSHVMSRGASRGGNAALLLAVRDKRITVASSASGPTDIYRAEVRDHYPSQYRCQFFDNKTEQQSRQRMLASSPLLFPVLPNVQKVWLDHGDQDDVVPLWNSSEMADRLKAANRTVIFHVYPGQGHDLGNSPDFRAVQGEIYNEFLAN